MKAIVINKTGRARDTLSLVEVNKYVFQDKAALVRTLRSPTNSAYLHFIPTKFRQKQLQFNLRVW